jgi:hypothetical protein
MLFYVPLVIVTDTTSSYNEKSRDTLFSLFYKLLTHFGCVLQVDKAGDEWAQKHAAEILWLDYEDCRLDTPSCFTKIYEFVGVDPSHVTGKHKGIYESTFLEMHEQDSTLDYISNRGEIKEVLGGNGWGHMISGEVYTPIQIMMYHTDETFLRTLQTTGTNTVYYGNDPNLAGHGNRFTAARLHLEKLDSEALIVLCADRDCWTHFPMEETFKSVNVYRRNFENIRIEYPNAVVASAEVACCPTALTHISPGDLFSSTGKRTKRACMSGEWSCLWKDNKNVELWRKFMLDLAIKRGRSIIGRKRAFLEGSVLVGKAKDLITFIDRIKISDDEDDRAVLADYMYRFPNEIVLDYEQVLLGEAREVNIQKNQACPSWHKEFNARQLEESHIMDFLSEVDRNRRPLFLFSPRYHGCDHIKKPVPESLPSWGKNGIAIQPALDHINRVVYEDESIVLLPQYGRVPDYRQGPELPYFIDNTGVWTSALIRGRTDQSTFTWRLTPTEENKFSALQMLMKEYETNPYNPRWKALIENLRGGVGFFYWAWCKFNCSFLVTSSFAKER